MGALATATRLASRMGVEFSVLPSGPSLRGIHSFPGGSVRAETRTFLSSLLIPGSPALSSGALLRSEVTLDHYLVSAVTRRYASALAQYSEVTLLKANTTVTIKRPEGGSWSAVASGVHCSILNQPMNDPSDKALAIPQYRGPNIVAWGHFQSSVDLKPGDQVVEGSRLYLASHDLNTTLMEGIVIARLDLRT